MFRKLYSLALSIVFAFFVAAVPLVGVYAQCATTEQEVSIDTNIPNTRPSGTGTYCVPLNPGSTDITQNPIVAFLKAVIQFLAAGIGIALVGGFVAGGLVYMTARANAGQVQKGEEIIRNAIIGIALYVFMFAILNFLIPGGILN